MTSRIVSLDRQTVLMAIIEVRLGGQRVALKRFQASRRGSGAGAFSIALPVEWGLGGGVVVVVVLLWGARRGGHLVLVYRRPIRAATAVGSALSLFVPYVAVAGGIPLAGSPSYYWEIADPLGTGMVMLDEEGARVRHQTFTPFGRVHAEAGGSALRTFFAGHRRDEASGMFYMQARWYDPSSGTMLSVDPLVPVLDDPLSSNPYTYSRNNPTNLTDPDGQCWRVGIACGVNEMLLGTVKEYNAVLKNGDEITITVTEIFGQGKFATLDGAALDGTADADAADASLQNAPSSSSQDQGDTGATAGNDLASQSENDGTGLPNEAQPAGAAFKTLQDAELDASRAVLDAAKGSPNEFLSEVHFERGKGFSRTEPSEEKRGHASFAVSRSLVTVVHSHTGSDTSSSRMATDRRAALSGTNVITVFPSTGAVVRIDTRGKFSDLRGGIFEMRPADLRRR